MEQYSAPLTPEQLTHNKSSVTGMVLGIVSLVVIWFPIVGLILAIVGLSVSNSNRKFAATHGFKENSMNTAGYVTSLVGLIAGIVTLICFILLMVFVVSSAVGIWRYIVLPEIM
jgi:ABC-type Fe3+ transport system permease subunit